MSKRLVLVGCGSDKENKKTYSWRMYKSDYFQKRMTVAMLMGQPAILSAKHGFLKASERIDTYDEDMRQKKEYQIQSWALSVANNIPNFYNEIVILAGKKYRNPLQSILKEDGYTVFSPFESEDIRGIGDQISWCKETAERIESGKNPKDLLESVDNWK